MEIATIQAIMELFEHSSLNELHITCSEYTIGMKRGVPGSAPACDAQTVQTGSAQETDKTRPAPGSGAAGAASKTREACTTEIITSPIVGTFYQTPAPDAPPYVEEGDVVEKGTVICTIEAMKMMNQLETDFSCEIVRVIAPQATLVEYGQPLFEVKRR